MEIDTGKLFEYIKAIGIKEFLKHAVKIDWFRKYMMERLSVLGQAMEEEYNIKATRVYLKDGIRVELEMDADKKHLFEERFFDLINGLREEHPLLFKVFADDYDLKEIKCQVTETGVTLFFSGSEELIDMVEAFLRGMNVEGVEIYGREEEKGAAEGGSGE